MLTAARLTVRLQRWEIAIVAAGCLGLAAAAAWLALDMRAIWDRCGTPDASATCDVIYVFQESHGSQFGLVQTLIEYVPFVIGLVLGVPIVSREVEQRTAQIAWPMARSRLRWLAWRMVPTLLMALVLVAVLAVAADQMVRAYFPQSDIGFSYYEARGLPLVMRTALIFAAGMAIGALVGRLLPTLLIGIGLSVGVFIALAIALPHWAPATVLADMETDPAAMIGGRLHTEIQYRLPGGEVVSADEGEMYVEVLHEEAGGEPDPALMPETIITGISTDRYSEVVLRESVVLGAGTLLLAGVAGAVVHRRRPE